MEKFIPYKGILLVEEVKPEEKQINGIIIAESVAEKQEGARKAKVVAISPIHPGAFNVGDIVLFAQYAGVNVEMNNKKYLILDESEDVFGRVEQIELEV